MLHKLSQDRFRIGTSPALGLIAVKPVAGIRQTEFNQGKLSNE
jgi:hypothetical protein